MQDPNGFMSFRLGKAALPGEDDLFLGLRQDRFTVPETKGNLACFHPR
jgi:hypothetical protein